MIYVINLCECKKVASCLSIDEASIALENAVQESDGFYTEDDFAVMDEEEYTHYILYSTDGIVKDGMITLLPKDLKQQIKVRVNLSYSFRIEYADGIFRIAKILEEHNLKPVISSGFHYGPSKDLKCQGSTDLLTAEEICKQLDRIPTHSQIVYKLGGSFTLTE